MNAPMTVPMNAPTLTDVYAARERVYRALTPTPLLRHALLDRETGLEIFVKHENHNPTCAFKVRGGLNLIGSLSPDERRGVITATTGNHGQSIAFACRREGVPCTIVVPLGNNPEKNAAMRALGAELVEEGKDYDEAVAVADRLVRERGLRLVHSTNDKDVVAGAATLSLEILEQAPRLEAMVMAVGGGSQAVGALTVARKLMPALKVYAVQAEGAAASHDSWLAKQAVEVSAANTFAEGIATRRSYELTLPAMIEGLAGFVKVSDADLAEAMRTLVRTTHTLVEGAGAAGFAGLMRLREQLAGKSVAIVMSGANIDTPTLRKVLNKEL
jgi:threonine dehydratase